MKRINWNAAASWVGALAMVGIFMWSRCDGSAQAMDQRVKSLEIKVPVIENTVIKGLENVDKSLINTEKRLENIEYYLQGRKPPRR